MPKRIISHHPDLQDALDEALKIADAFELHVVAAFIAQALDSLRSRP